MALQVRNASIFSVAVPDVAIQYTANLPEATNRTLLTREIEVWGPATSVAASSLAVSGVCNAASSAYESLSAGSITLKLVAIAALAFGSYFTGEVLNHQLSKAHPIYMLRKAKPELSAIIDWKALALISDYQEISGKKSSDLSPLESENLRYINSRLKKYVETVLPRCTVQALALENAEDVQRFFNVAILSGVDLWTDKAQPLVKAVLASKRKLIEHAAHF